MSLYRVVRLIGSSSISWEEAAKAALEEAAKHLEDLRRATRYQDAGEQSRRVSSPRSSILPLSSGKALICEQRSPVARSTVPTNAFRPFHAGHRDRPDHSRRGSSPIVYAPDTAARADTSCVLLLVS